MAITDRGDRNAEPRGAKATEPRSADAESPADHRLNESPLSPNELDQTDESEKAADITRAGEEQTRKAEPGPDCPGEAAQSPAPCAPDGRSADRYAG